MKAIIFAGGTGTRLWPLSRKNSPKQFEKIAGKVSSLELAVNRLLPEISYKEIFISSNIRYKEIIRKKIPQIPEGNLILEPEKKDVGPAIALVTSILYRLNPDEPIAILWSDHLVKKEDLFKKIIKSAGSYIKKNPNKIVFITHKPRFPSVNLGYINFGSKIMNQNNFDYYEFLGLKYRPSKKIAKTFFNSKNYAWNLGYFVTTPRFIYNAYKKFSPNIFNNIENIVEHYDKADFDQVLKSDYGKSESISFDNAILEKLDKKDACVIVEDIGWSDIGSWEALKEALQINQNENITQGNIYLEKVSDCLIYNYEDKKLIVGVDLKDGIIINTPDVLLITTKHSMPKIKKIVESFKGTKNDHLT